MTGMEDILNRLVGPKSMLRDLSLEDGYIYRQMVDIIKEVLQPERPTNLGRVETSIRNIIQKVNQLFGKNNSIPHSFFGIRSFDVFYGTVMEISKVH